MNSKNPNSDKKDLIVLASLGDERKNYGKIDGFGLMNHLNEYGRCETLT